VTSESR